MTRLEIVVQLVAHGPATRRPNLEHYFGIADDLIAEDTRRTELREMAAERQKVAKKERETEEKLRRRWWHIKTRHG